MIIATPEDMERIKVYDNIVQEYNSKIREIKHGVITRLESAFVYGIGFDDVKQLDVEDLSCESAVSLGKMFYNKHKFMSEQKDICEILNDAEYADGCSNPLQTDDNFVEVEIRVRIHFYGITPRIYVYLDFGKSIEMKFEFILREYMINKFKTDKPGYIDKTCTLDDAINFMTWFYENDAFKL